MTRVPGQRVNTGPQTAGLSVWVENGARVTRKAVFWQSSLTWKTLGTELRSIPEEGQLGGRSRQIQSIGECQPGEPPRGLRHPLTSYH